MGFNTIRDATIHPLGLKPLLNSNPLKRIRSRLPADFHVLSEGLIPMRNGGQKTARVETLPQFMEALAGLKKANETASSRLFWTKAGD